MSLPGLNVSDLRLNGSDPCARAHLFEFRGRHRPRGSPAIGTTAAPRDDVPSSAARRGTRWWVVCALPSSVRRRRARETNRTKMELVGDAGASAAGIKDANRLTWRRGSFGSRAKGRGAVAEEIEDAAARGGACAEEAARRRN